MTKIKISGFFVFTISIILAFLSSYISEQNRINNELLDIINEKKAFTQDISKNIFYIYKNKSGSTKQLDDSIKKFVKNMNNKEESPNTVNIYNDKITKLWNKFYLSVQKFRDTTKTITPYSNILLEKIVKDIYNTNLMLIIEFDKLIKANKLDFSSSIENYKEIQYTLFFILVVLLIYLFTQVKTIITFIQKFLIISKNIITNSSVKYIKHIQIIKSDAEISQATNNFNYLIDKIDKSIQYSSNSIEHSCQSIELIEKNIEDLLELLSIMQDNKTINKDLTKKEDVVIQSLEELTSAAESLKALKTDLYSLINHSYLHKS